MKLRLFNQALWLLCLICIPGIGWAQNAPSNQPPDDFNEWLNRRVFEITKARINQRNNTNQSETPGLSSNSTSLVDKSSASDLVGIALNLAGLSSESSSMNATSMSATVSAYALKAATAGRNPLDPSFYNANRDWRRVSFTFGVDFPEGKVGDINERAAIFGIKFLPYDKRDASEDQQCDIVDQATGARRTASCVALVSDSLKKTGVEFARITRQVQDFLFDELKNSGKIDPNLPLPDFITTHLGRNFAARTLPLLGEAEIQKIDTIIAGHLNPFVEFDDTARSAIEQIRRKPQISFAAFTKQRSETRPDEYMAAAIFDLGFAPRWNFTMNAVFDYQNNKLMKDTKGGKVAAELQVQMTPEKRLAGRMPWLLSFAGNGMWMTDLTPVYQGQVKLTIPLWEGIEFPLSVSVASRTELIKEADVRGRFGFTLDLARLAQAFRGKLR